MTVAIAGHAGGEGERVLRILPDGEAILQNLLIGAVEAGIDEALRPAGALAGDALEEALAGGGASNTKVEVRKIGGLSEPSLSAGSKPWPIINVAGFRRRPPTSMMSARGRRRVEAAASSASVSFGVLGGMHLSRNMDGASTRRHDRKCRVSP